MKVLLYHDWPLAKDYLQPVEDVIRMRHPDWEIYEGGYHKPVANYNYDWVVTCDESSGGKSRGKRVLCIFHGLASKGQAFSTARRDAFVKTNTIFAVPGNYYATMLHKMGVPEERVHVTGLTKLTGFRRNVLYAPTHNPRLSAIPVIRDRIYELPDVRVMLHMWTQLGQKEIHRDYASYYPENDTTHTSRENLEWADVVIGDFGSIILEAITLGKQAIQVVNPDWKSFYTDLKGLSDEEISELPEVWYPKRYATQVHSFDDLYDALNIIPLGDSASRVVDIMDEVKI